MIAQKGEKLTGQFGYSSYIARIYIHTYLATTEYPDRRQRWMISPVKDFILFFLILDMDFQEKKAYFTGTNL